MLTFNDSGLLIPDTVIVSSVIELKQIFVENISSHSRIENFEKYIAYSNALVKLLGVNSLRQWINGSFVTQIQNPNDIDLVTFIDYRAVNNLRSELEDFGVKGAWKVFGVDAYIIQTLPEDHANHFFYKSDLAYWMNKFSKTRRLADGTRARKGFLEIIY